MAPQLDRRRFTAYCTAFGIAGTTMPQLLRAAVENGGTLTTETLAAAEQLAGLQFSETERELMLAGLEELRKDYAKLREVALDNAVAPALAFDPVLPEFEPRPRPTKRRFSWPRSVELPGDPAELALLPISDLGRLIKNRKISSVELTQLYLDRLEKFDPALHCVVNLTTRRALEQAKAADHEISRGRWKEPLHGIPWGAKDLLAVRGYPTTWGAKPFAEQTIDVDAAVVERLDRAGAILVAKLSLGALAWGDVWFGGTTKNPWNAEQGSSGSSAGPGAATAAGLVGFAIGSETWGSIVSPSTRCGVSGLRPTFGRISRHGAMALSWSMDKLGPMCRSVADCALVFEAVHGADPRDATAVDRPFVWEADLDPKSLRVGYVPAHFEGDPAEGLEGDEAAKALEERSLDLAVLDTLRDLGVELVEFELPEQPVSALSFILTAEAGAAFDELSRSGRDDELVRQIENAWPNVFRQARTIPAVEYIQANRVRTLLMQQMHEAMAQVDLFVAPSFAGDHLLLTNLSGHPAVVLPSGFRSDGTPWSITFTGHLHDESTLLTLARAYQEATEFHLEHPEEFA